MAELLIKAEGHWMDKLSQEEVLTFDEKKLVKYEARSQIGDVVAVMPDGHVWGKKEGLPKFVVVKVPDMSVEEAREFLSPEIEIDEETGKGTIVQSRKMKLDSDEVEKIKLKGGVESLKSQGKSTFFSKIKVKPRKIKQVKEVTLGE